MGERMAAIRPKLRGEGRRKASFASLIRQRKGRGRACRGEGAAARRMCGEHPEKKKEKSATSFLSQRGGKKGKGTNEESPGRSLVSRPGKRGTSRRIFLHRRKEKMVKCKARRRKFRDQAIRRCCAPKKGKKREGHQSFY